MSKLTLTDLVNLQNETTAVNAINFNNAAVVSAVDNTLSRDGTMPNQMEAPIDMNSNRILNLPQPTTNYEPLRFIDIKTLPVIPVIEGQTTILSPEMFGTVGVDAAQDTAAWITLIQAANFVGGRVRVRMYGPLYRFNGTAVVNDNLVFKGLPSIHIDISAETEIRQLHELSRTFKFLNCGDIEISGGRLIGFAQTQIDAGIPLTETFLNLSSGSDIAAIYAQQCDKITVRDLTTQNHFGRDIHTYGVEKVIVRGCRLVGVGKKYNDPDRDHHQGNGEDAAIYAIPYDFSVNGTAWKQVLDVSDNHIEGHSFGVRSLMNHEWRMHNNYFGIACGQYHVYGSDDDGIVFTGNHFDLARIISIKLQHENLAGTLYGPDWTAFTVYNVGDVVRSVDNILWVCTSNHMSGASFTSTNWAQHPRYIRRGAVINSNLFTNNGGGVGFLAPTIPQVNGRNIWSEGFQCCNNSFIGNKGSIIRLERCIKIKVSGNSVDGGQYGLLGRYVSGTISDNDIANTTDNAIRISLAWPSNIENNKFWDCGYAGATDADKAAVLIYELDVNDPAFFAPTPRNFFRNNGFIYTNGIAADYLLRPIDCPGSFLFYDDDARNTWEIEGTYGTPTTKKFRVDGTVSYQYRNHFVGNGYNNPAQNERDFTLNFADDVTLVTPPDTTNIRNVLGTFMALMQSKRVIN